MDFKPNWTPGFLSQPCFHQVVGPQTNQFASLLLSFLAFQNRLYLCSTPRAFWGPEAPASLGSASEMWSLRPQPGTTDPTSAFSQHGEV